MRQVLLSLLTVCACLLYAPGVSCAASPTADTTANIIAQSPPALFASEDAAQAHCPRDTVVWLNMPTGIYHYKGERWYGRTRHGAYVCEKEAIAAGDRATENGQ
jgi:hypothetical protein